MNTRLRSSLAGAAMAAGLMVPLIAQSVLEPVSVYHGSHVVNPIVLAATPEQSSVTSAIDDSLPLLRVGAFALHPTLTYRLARSSGVEFAPGLSATTTLQSISAGVLVEAGNHWRIDYSPTWIHYSNPLFADSTDHWIDVHGAYGWHECSVEMYGTYASASPVLVELAQQAHQVSYRTGQQLDYKLAPHSRVTFSGEETYRKASAVRANNSLGWQASNWRGISGTGAFAYDVTRHTTLSALVTRGYANPSQYHSMDFTRPELQATWTPVEALTAGVTAGNERRRFNGPNGRTLGIPTYAANVIYRPWPTTMVVASASRGTTLSYLPNTAIKAKNWDARFEQRLLKHLFLSFQYDDQDTGYIEDRPGLPTSRSDRLRTLSARLAVPLFDRGYVATYVDRVRNTSSRLGFGFTNHQYGVEITFKF